MTIEMSIPYDFDRLGISDPNERVIRLDDSADPGVEAAVLFGHGGWFHQIIKVSYSQCVSPLHP